MKASKYSQDSFHVTTGGMMFKKSHGTWHFLLLTFRGHDEHFVYCWLIFTTICGSGIIVIASQIIEFTTASKDFLQFIPGVHEFLPPPPLKSVMAVRELIQYLNLVVEKYTFEIKSHGYYLRP